MPISFLDLTPKPLTATVVIETMEGPQEIELCGVTLRILGDISKRFPSFAKVLDGGGGSIMDSPDAMAALVAAALGHPGEKEYERHLSTFPSGDVLNLALAVVRLTFPQADAGPLSTGANGAAVDVSLPTSPSPLNN